MPNKIDDLSPEQIEQILTNLRVGIAKIESGGSKDPYQARPGFKKDKNGKIIEPRKRISSATGKYQFLKSWLGKQGNGMMGIHEFSKTKSIFKEAVTMDDFANQPALQEEYFSYYAKEVLIPNALKTSVKNPLNLSIGEIASQFHFQDPITAKRTIQNGTLVKSTGTNTSGNRYIDVYRQGLKENNLKPVTSLDIINKKKQEAIKSNSKPNLSPIEKQIEKEIEKTQSQFEKQNKEIDEMDIDTKLKENFRKKLFQDYVDGGKRDIVNDYINKTNSKNEKAYNEQLKDYNNLIEMAQNTDIVYKEDADGKKIPTGRAYFKFDNNNDKAIWNNLISKYDIGGKGPKILGNKNIDLNKFNNILKTEHLKLTGEELDLDLNNIENKKLESSFWNTISNKDEVTKIKNLKTSQVKAFKPKVLIDEVLFPEKSMIDKYEPEDEKEDEKEGKKDSKKGTVTEEDKKGSTNKGLTKQYFDNELALNSTNDQEFNYTPGKKELPIDAIVGMSLGLIGNEQAKNAKIPLRTEEISLAMRNYTAELMQKSKEGLPVEVEAQMKSLLADAYQGGLENIVNASGGNSATVLGNLGQLEQAKNKGLVGIQIADYEAKDRAFAQYGKAIEYINDFDTRRDIANHEIRFKEGKQKQNEGKALATAGFAKMIDAIKYDRENGPGSANDMYRGLLMQKMFGYDPKAKDDGTGTVVGTKSWYEANKQLVKDKFKVTQGLHKTFQTLNPDQQAAVDNVIGQTQDPNTLAKIMEYVQTDGVDPNKLNFNRLNQAIRSDDMGLLSKTNPIKQTPIETILNPATEQKGVESNDTINIAKPIGIDIQESTPQMTDDPELVKKMFSKKEVPVPNGLVYSDNDVETPVQKEDQNPLTQFNQYFN